MEGLINNEILKKVLLNCDALDDFDEYDLNNPEFTKALEAIEELVITVSREATFSEDTLKQLNMLLRYTTNLKVLNIQNQKGQMLDVSSVFDNLSASIESVTITNLGFQSGINQKSLDSLTNLNALKFNGCVVPQLPVLSSSKGSIFVDSTSIILDETLVEFGLQHELVTGKTEANGVLKAINGNSPISLSLYEKYSDKFQGLDKDICISIKNVAELSLEKLELLKSNPAIKTIHIEGGCYKLEHLTQNSFLVYSLDEYAAVRSEIDKIVSQVKLPDKNDEDREKKIFAQVYRLLGEKISYDHYAISKEGKKDEALKYTCRNLKNGLCGVERDGRMENLTVCAGYADILRNVLSCFGIESIYVSSRSCAELELKGGAYVEKTDKDGNIVYRNGTNDPMGHAYNLVFLDGKEYYADLTWDESYIKAKRLPLPNFLKSASEFKVSHANVGFEPVFNTHADETITNEQQYQLFGDVIDFNWQSIQDMVSEGYLSGFVSQYIGAVKGSRESVTPGEVVDMMDYIKTLEDYILEKKIVFRIYL